MEPVRRYSVLLKAKSRLRYEAVSSPRYGSDPELDQSQVSRVTIEIIEDKKAILFLPIQYRKEMEVRDYLVGRLVMAAGKRDTVFP